MTLILILILPRNPLSTFFLIILYVLCVGLALSACISERRISVCGVLSVKKSFVSSYEGFVSSRIDDDSSSLTGRPCAIHHSIYGARRRVEPASYSYIYSECSWIARGRGCTSDTSSLPASVEYYTPPPTTIMSYRMCFPALSCT